MRGNSVCRAVYGRCDQRRQSAVKALSVGGHLDKSVSQPIRVEGEEDAADAGAGAKSGAPRQHRGTGKEECDEGTQNGHGRRDKSGSADAAIEHHGGEAKKREKEKRNEFPWGNGIPCAREPDTKAVGRG